MSMTTIEDFAAATDPIAYARARKLRYTWLAGAIRAETEILDLIIRVAPDTNELPEARIFAAHRCSGELACIAARVIGRAAVRNVSDGDAQKWTRAERAGEDAVILAIHRAATRADAEAAPQRPAARRGGR